MTENGYSGYSVLVVDDNAAMVRIVMHSLKRMGFVSIDTASDGAEANQKMNEKVYDIVFLDWNMPNLDGCSVIRDQRKNPAYNDSALVMVTAESQPKHLIEALKAGATLYIIKPFTETHFIERASYVVAWLNKKRSKTPSAFSA